MTSLNELYQELIIDHSRSPRNFGKLDSADAMHEGFNPLCGDKIIVYLRHQQNRVQAIQFEGCGCAISMASASLMTEAVIGKSTDEVSHLFTGFQALVMQKTPLSGPAPIEKLNALAGVAEFPMRVKCATLAWHTALAALSHVKNTSPAILQFTDKAIEHINKSLIRFPRGGFRLSIKKTGCSGYKYIPEVTAEPKANDLEFIAEQGLKVFIDAACVKVVAGTVVDLVSKGLGQKQLVFNNPNVSGECGCGESFHLPEDHHG